MKLRIIVLSLVTVTSIFALNIVSASVSGLLSMIGQAVNSPTVDDSNGINYLY